MIANKIFTGDIYYEGKIAFRDALLVWFPKKGFVRLDYIKNKNTIKLLNNGKARFLLMGTSEINDNFYVELSSIKPFINENIERLKKVN